MSKRNKQPSIINPLNNGDLTAFSQFRNLVTLGSCLQIGLDEKMSILNLEKCRLLKFSPTSNYTEVLLSDLANSGLLQKLYHNQIYLLPSLYQLNLEKIDTDNQIMNILNNLFGGDKYFIGYKEEKLNLWKEIAIEECIEYLKSSLDDVHFQYLLGDKARLCMRKLLEGLSPGQIFALI